MILRLLFEDKTKLNIQCKDELDIGKHHNIAAQIIRKHHKHLIGKKFTEKVQWNAGHYQQ